MARIPKQYMSFETKEEFDKWYDKVRYDGVADGFKKGSIWVLSYVQELFRDMFKPDAFREAEREINERHIENWRREGVNASIKEELDERHNLVRIINMYSEMKRKEEETHDSK